ncbi:putative sarcosine oxidase [Panicum miliaceum]|uniref:Sarcosine oxidase n=1 Tax=Panicum miliaceum TaxID=4540 RepID=A0A3L6T9W8_PANMI|nr:putative sarcosine oxidase [Panicum miliaceum]
MGSCAAYAASSRGARALLLEQFDLLHHRGSSHGESRTIRATYPQAHYPPMVRLSRRLWEEAQADAGYRVLTPTPHLDLGPRDDPEFRAAIGNGGAAVVAGGGAEPSSWPWAGVFRVPEGWAAASSELGGVMKATKAVAMFQALAVKKGAVVRDRMEVIDIARRGEGSILVRTASGEEFHGAKCIVTVGAWTSKLVKSVVGMDLPVQPVHTLICHWKVKPGHKGELTTEAGFPTFASYGDPYIYSTPSMEFPGLIKIAKHGGPPCDPDSRDWSTGAADLAEPVARWIDTVMPGHVDTAGGPVIRQSCMYSMTPDEDYVVDFLGGEFGKDVIVGAGFSGHGFKNGPAVGRILAEMAMDGESRSAVEAGVDLEPLRIDRFVDNPKGNLKNPGDQGRQ